MTEELAIYVMPTEEGLPPRAVVGEPYKEGIRGVLVSWSADTGSWIDPGGMPIPSSLGEAITEHAKNLGVEW